MLRAIEILSVAGLIYLGMTSFLTGIQLGLEKLTNYEERGLSRRRCRRLLLLDDGSPEVPTHVPA